MILLKNIEKIPQGVGPVTTLEKQTFPRRRGISLHLQSPNSNPRLTPACVGWGFTLTGA